MKRDQPPASGVRRTIILLRALNRRPLSTIEDLHQETGLAKPTISRMLTSLQAEGLVVRAQYGSYYITSAVTFGNGTTQTSPLTHLHC